MSDKLTPLSHSHEVGQLEAELKDLFLKLYADSLGPTARDIDVYGAPHLGSFGLVERNIDMDGLTVLRETTEDRIRYLFRAWRHRNPERGLHFLRLYLSALFGTSASVWQMWQKKDAAYPEVLKVADEIADSGENPDDYFLTSRVRVDVDTEVVPAKLLASLKSAVAARILLNVRIGRAVTGHVGMVQVGYASNVLRVGQYGVFVPLPEPVGFVITEQMIGGEIGFLCTEADDRLVTEAQA